MVEAMKPFGQVLCEREQICCRIEGLHDAVLALQLGGVAVRISYDEIV
jgi:hypothetical protein